MTETQYSSEISFVKGKERKPIHYEIKAINNKTREVYTVRRSKKGGSMYSDAFLDIIYFMSKFDPYYMDRLVQDKHFPLFLKQMQEAYEKSKGSIIREGWSPATIKEIEDYASKKIQSEATKHD